MLKKIQVQDLGIGMYIHEICASWMDNPFWKKSFMLSNEKDLRTFHEYRIKEVWIDTSKGLDVSFKAKTVSMEEEKQQINETLEQIAVEEHKIQRRVPLHDEIERFKKVMPEIKRGVISIFDDVRDGNPIDIDLVSKMVDDISFSNDRNPDAMLTMVRQKSANDYNYMHSIAVSGLMMALGKELDLDRGTIKEVGVAGLLLDIGKVKIPKEIINKAGKLTNQEFDKIKTHPLLGFETLKLSNDLSDIVLDVCLHHHERIDGDGYPHRLAGDNIGYYARMASICDVYDAISSTRSYQASWEPAESLRKMTEWKKGQFDEKMFGSFVKAVGIYPSGTLVKLKSGRLAVVMEQTEASLLKPIVKVFFSVHSNAHIYPELLDLSTSPDSIVTREEPKQWGFDLKKISQI